MHVAAVIRRFSPEYDVESISARRQYKANAWFKRGTLFRSALDVMRGTAEPLTVRQIIDRMLAAKGIANARSDQVRDIQCAVLASLQHRRGKGRPDSCRGRSGEAAARRAPSHGNFPLPGLKQTSGRQCKIQLPVTITKSFSTGRHPRHRIVI